ncbi:MAG: ribonuclease HII [Candidatus Gribaldobacteria bacterium]|nr:ribonuclease HII [Candidatus Gribaldobacteria bacterium]
MNKNPEVIFGVDEVGRGPLAGPVVVCALIAPASYETLIFEKGIKDSKKIKFQKREAIYEILKKDPKVKWGIGRVSEKVIDKINILQATKLAMVRAVKSLEKKIGHKADQLLIDGNFAIPITRPQQSIIKGDEKISLIALASIVAKVHRDRLMDNYHKQYPQYGFNQHKGYGTKLHLEAIQKNGFCKIHRKTFKVFKLKN